MSRTKAELFVDTDLNYVPFIETPEKYTPQEATIYYFESETTPNEFTQYVISDESGGLYNPIGNCSSSKSSSTASDACSSTRLLDGITDLRTVNSSLNTSVGDSTIISPDLKSKTAVVNTDFEYTIWTKIQSSMTSSMRSKYLRKTRSRNKNGFVWRSFIGITRNKLSLLLLVTMLVCASIVLVIAVLTVNSYNSLRVVKSDANTNDQYTNYSDEWWKSAIFYEIFPASFKDSDGDGFGDMDGIRQQLPYIRDLGVTAVRLNSIFSALDYPYQYEHIIDFRNIDPHIGPLHSFKALIREIHKQRMYVVLDINPTITSDQHPWAAHWLINSTGKYSHYYVYSKQITMESTSSTATDRKTSEMEETHLSFGGHLYLNWSHPSVVKNMLDCLRFWVRIGVDGFYLRSLEQIKIDDRFPETIFQILDSIRDVLNDGYSEKGQSPFSRNAYAHRHKKILIASRQSLKLLSEKIERQLTANYFATKNKQKSEKDSKTSNLFDGHLQSTHQNRDIFSHFDLIESFLEINLNKTENIREQVNFVFLNNHNSDYWALWTVGSATTSRLASRIGNDFIAATTFLLIMLPGSINILYGDEIGLKDSLDPITNKEYRGGQLCPMPWDMGANGNFSSANITLWMPLNANFMKNNIKRQSEAVSRLQQLIKFRKNNFVVKSIKKHGNYLFHYINDGEIVLERYFSNTTNDGIVTRERFVLFANLGSEVNVKSFLAKFHLANIEIASNPNRLTQFLYIGSLRLDPGEAIIARLV